MGQELAFESLSLALESNRGTGIANPTHRLNMAGTITPVREDYEAPDATGTLAEYSRSRAVRTRGEMEAEGDLDLNTLPVLLNMGVKANATGVGAGQRVAKVNVTAPGTGYANTFAVTGSSGGGTGFAGVGWATGGAVQGVIITNPGSAYTSAPTMDLSAGGGTGATATATLTSATAATKAKIWDFVRTMTSDDLKSATEWWGDSNTSMLKGIYGMLDEIGITADATGTDACKQSCKGLTQFPSKGAAPTIPAAAYGNLIMPLNMQLWIDAAQGYGNTEITGRVLSAELTFETGVTYKYPAQGPAGALDYSKCGRVKTHPECKIVLELEDFTQYDQFAADTQCRVRVRLNGPQIETNFYEFVEWDIYGKLAALAWGDEEGSNRTVEFTIKGKYDSCLASDLAVHVQNQKTSL